jgi:uncharacterized repeat protein (TIGR01451 family)
MKLKTLVGVFLLLTVSLLISGPAFSENLPMPPKDLTANVESDNSVNLTWTAPIDTSVAGFNVFRKDDLAGAKQEKINNKLITESTYNDRSISKGRSYSYECRSVNSDGVESLSSNAAGAPKMSMSTSATVTHMGKVARIATPGDTIKYDIDFANRGFGIAKNIVIIYAIPKGTTFIAGTAKCPKYKVALEYFDNTLNKWVGQVLKEENISKVRFSVMDDVYPVVREKDVNDTASLKVMVNY